MTTRGKWLDNCLHKNRVMKLKSGSGDNDVARCFQVCVNVLEGKRLKFAYSSQATSYVMVSLDKVKYRSGVRQNMRVPFYRENFVFELFTNATELKRKCLWLAVMEPSCGVPRMLGEAGVDLVHVWRQPHHTITRKWVQLTLPNDAKSDPVGYLKVDISISVRAEVLNAPAIEERIEDNLLLPCGSEQQPACYQITIYRAYNIPCSASTRPDIRGIPPSTSVRVSFCDLLGETSSQHRTNNPVYVERVSMVEVFPNTCNTIQLEVCSENGMSKVLASTRLNLSDISHGGENGFLPTFGPSLLHMYGPWHPDCSEDGPFHRGALLVYMKTIVPYYRHCLRAVYVERVNAEWLDTEWIVENFVMFCPIFEVSMLDKTVSGTSSGIAITSGEIPVSSTFDQDAEEFARLMTEISGRNVRWNNHVAGHLVLETCPVLRMAARLPDFRFRMYMNNVLLGIVSDLESELLELSARLAKNDYEDTRELLDSLYQCNDDVLVKIKRFLDVVHYSSLNKDLKKYTTELDYKLVQLQKEKIEKIYYRIISRKTKTRRFSVCNKSSILENCQSKKMVKIMLAEGKSVLQELKDLIYKIPNGWPHVSVWLLSNGSRVAHAKLTPDDIIHSVTPEQSGRQCGKIQSVYLKPIKCSNHHPMDCQCISGKVELLAWMGAFRQRGAFQPCIPDGYTSTETGLDIECKPMGLECCVNIYRAKLSCMSDGATGLSPFVRIHFINNVKDTQVCQNTSSPVWSEVIRISGSANVTRQRLETNPPEVLVEVYHWDAARKGIFELLGRLTVTPIYLDAQDMEPPLLEWLDIDLGKEQVGTIQMSTQLIQINESALNKSCIDNSTQELLQKVSDLNMRTVLTSDVPEPLPLNILPANKNYKIDVYFWGLREVSITSKPLVTLELEDITVKSAIISQYNANCNFPHGRISQKFQGNLSNGPSHLTINLYDTTTFGRTLFAGSNTKNPQKFLVNWIPKKERDDMVLLKPIVNNMFVQVTRRTFVKRQLTYPVYENSKTCENETEQDTKTKWERVKTIFSKHVGEEEMMLLPVYSKGREIVVKETEDDWWMRYYSSLNEKASGESDLSSNRITIYDSELEAQPDFSRFKEWCNTIKIYNGCKSGIPEKDKKLHCGYLKASIAIYHWPPIEGTVAVSSCGDDLGRGYFDSYPDNDPARYLVRVYAVKCSGLAVKGLNTTSRCYVTVQCSSKNLCDRESSVPRETEPVFGKMYELDCSLPEEYLLKISVLDCGPTADELIGCTSIDLEDRAFTKYRATVGLATEYNIHGPNKWRDSERPSAILEELCEKNHLPAPEYPDPSSLILNGVEYKDLDSGTKYTSPLMSKENLCLSVLHRWHTMPVCGHRLVPEHVEVRTLYDPDKPGVEQGKIHMWVDMFSLDSQRMIPAPVSIRPRPEEYYELRITVWGVHGVKLPEKSRNIYVRAWIGPSDEAQDTDIYISKNGEGHFNWRMIFQFQYKHTERMLVLHDKGPFTEVTELFPPILVVQVLDIDAPTLQDFLGILTLDLSRMPRGARQPHNAHTVLSMRKVNMFAVRNARGWWPLRMVDRNTGNYYTAGMIELEIAVLPQEKALLMPVGIGRDAPAPLPDPIQRTVTRTKSESIYYSSPVIWTLVVLGFILLAVGIYWQLPVIVFSVIPSTNM